MNIGAIYPEIDKTIISGLVALRTIVRIKRGDKWYDVSVVENTSYGQDVKPEDAVIQTYDRFLKQVYMASLHYEVPYFIEPSTDQREETERINPIIFKKPQ